MTNGPSNPEAVFSVRPLVRYVDEAQAVLDAHLALRGVTWGELDSGDRSMEVRIRLSDSDGDTFEHRAFVDLSERSGMVRFELTNPARWWPAGMGDQTLYDLSVTLSTGGDVIDEWCATIGLTSVRPTLTDARQASGSVGRVGGHPAADVAAGDWLSRLGDERPILLVNGQERPIQSVVPVEPADEQHVLPAGGDSLLVVRDHFGSEVLYQAADRAGILMLQGFGVASGVSPELGGPSTDDGERSLLDQIDRLVGHPSLAGWVVREDDPNAGLTARRIHLLDPTRRVFLARS